MFHPWAWSAVVGVILGLVFFVLLLVPILVWESRRFGRLRVSRTLASGAFAVFGVTLVAYTLLPLPGPDWCQVHGGVKVSLRPFTFVDRVFDATRGLSPAAALRSFAVLQVLMNIVLFLPLGAFVRRLLGQSHVVAGLAGLGTSVLIELTQGTGFWGLYDCAYRFGDIDDVIMNTLGAVIGSLLASVLLFWVPEAHPDETRRHDPRPVTRRRRLAGMIVDAVAFYGVWGVLTLSYRLADRADLRPRGTVGTAWADTAAGFVALLVVLIVPALVGSGASFGQRAMWLTPERSSVRRFGPVAAFVRTLTGFGGFALLTLVEGAPHIAGTTTAEIIRVVSLVLLGIGLIVLVVDRSARGLSFRLSGQAVVDSRTEAADESA